MLISGLPKCSVWRTLYIAGLLWVLNGCHQTPVAHRIDNSTALYLDNVTLVDVATGTSIPNQALFIREGKIQGIHSAGQRPPPGSRSMDLQGAYVSPGLVDMHVHLHDIKELSTCLAYGVTTVRNMRGFPAHLRWRHKVASGQWLGANLVTASPTLAGPNSHALNTSVGSPEEARAKIRIYQARHFDLIKVYGGHSVEVLDTLLDEARLMDIPVAKHAPHAEALPLEILAGLQSLEHVEDIFQGPLNHTFDNNQLEQIAIELATLGVPLVPTLATFDHLTQLSEHKQRFVDAQPLAQINPFFRRMYGESSVKRWLQADEKQTAWNIKERDFLLHITRTLDNAGVPLLVGSDTGTMYMTAGLSTHREMQLMQQAGLSPATVLRSATLGAAEALENADTYGRVNVGYWADLILTTDNPLEDISTLQKPLAVIKQGQWLDRLALERILVSANNPSGWFAGLAMLLEHWWMD